MLWVVHRVWCTLNQLVMKICYRSKAVCQIGWAAGMFTFQLLTRKEWKHKRITFSVIWIFSILAQSVELWSSHSCVCTYSGCVTAVVQPTSPLLRNVYSLAQMCVQLSGFGQTDSSQHLECHLCQNVHPSQVLHQPPVVNWLLWCGHHTPTHTHTHTHTHIHTHVRMMVAISSLITCRKW